MVFLSSSCGQYSQKKDGLATVCPASGSFQMKISYMRQASITPILCHLFNLRLIKFHFCVDNGNEISWLSDTMHFTAKLSGFDLDNLWSNVDKKRFLKKQNLCGLVFI